MVETAIEERAEAAQAGADPEGQPDEGGPRFIERKLVLRIEHAIADQLVKRQPDGSPIVNGEGEPVSSIPPEGALAASLLSKLGVPAGLQVEHGVRKGRGGKTYSYEYVTVTATPARTPVDVMADITRLSNQYVRAGMGQREAFMRAATESDFSEDRASAAYKLFFE